MVRQKHVDGDDDDDDYDGYDYTPAACIEHHGDYAYAPASSMYGDDDDDGYNYAPAA